jgi:hypothetical protein
LADAYDVYANAFCEAGEKLTEELLTERIPGLLLETAVKCKWVQHPSWRHRRGVVGGFLPGNYNPARYEPVPQAELTETFGGYKVRNGYGAGFRRYLEGRIAHWRVEALTRAKEGDSGERVEQASSDGATTEPNTTGTGKNRAVSAPQCPKRVSWLKDRLRERSWNKHDLARHGGPHHKTVQKVLDGFSVREDVLQKIADALSKRVGAVTVLDIPQD